jgi:hypothetical protein
MSPVVKYGCGALTAAAQNVIPAIQELAVYHVRRP